MRNPTMWIGIFCGGMLTALLMVYRVKGAIIVGILLVSIISWPRSTPVTYFPATDLGDSSFDFFKKVVAFHPIQRILVVQDWNISEYGGEFALAFITLVPTAFLTLNVVLTFSQFPLRRYPRLHWYSLCHGSLLRRDR